MTTAGIIFTVLFLVAVVAMIAGAIIISGRREREMQARYEAVSRHWDANFDKRR